jgi:lysophospholipase L1-like esterase
MQFKKYVITLSLLLSTPVMAQATLDNNDKQNKTSSGVNLQTTYIQGVAALAEPLSNASITVCDAKGVRNVLQTDADGSFRLAADKITAPVLLSAQKGDVQLASILATLQADTLNIANINPLTDKIASAVATTDLGLKGSLQLIAACAPGGANIATIEAANNELRTDLLDALKATGISEPDHFDPVTTRMKADDNGIGAILGQLYFNRNGYSNGSTNERGATLLYDRNVMEVRGSNPLDPHLKPWSDYKTRVFIAGDSTASNYPAEVMPRMGWGQTFNRQFKTDADVKVINVAQSGRSSRSFITEGWFNLIADNIQAGDYLLIQFGHNDEKCNVTGSTDWIFRCTYANAADGTPRYPAEQPDYSFQKTLEKYLQLAKDKGATPILITPVTRINQDKAVTNGVAGLFPITSSTHVTNKGDYPGDYSQTVIDTATANNVAVIDLDTRSREFANSLGEPAWKNYWLGVSDTTRYPYYADISTAGNIMNPDRTHFQEQGAEAIAAIIADGIKTNPAHLKNLTMMLKE